MQVNHNPLILLTGVPIACGLACLVLPDRLKSVSKLLALIVSALSLALSIYVFINKPVAWTVGNETLLVADNISAFIGVSVAVFALLVTVYSFGYIEKSASVYFGYVLMTMGCSLGVAYANNLVALLVFWGALAALLYLMVNINSTAAASSAAKKALIIIGATDALLLFGIALIWSMTGTLSIDKIHLPLNGAYAWAAYICVAIAGFAKAGAMPFNSWLPDVAEAAPASVTAYLPASLDKLLGIYLLFKASTVLFVMNGISNLVLAVIGSVTIVLAVIFALVQHDLKRLLGYHAVSQVGYMVLGIGTGTPLGIAGGLFHMLNNAIYKSCLFLTGGSVEKRTGTADLTKLGGLARYMPVTFVCFLVASLSISGIPPFNGFVSKWMVYQGIIESAGPKNYAWMAYLASAMFGSALTVASFMKLLHAVFLGRSARDFSFIKGAGFWMSSAALSLATLCLMFGIFAFGIPLKYFILPAMKLPVKFLGAWNPGIATILILLGAVTGAIIYLFTRSAPSREVGPFIGGEDIEKLDRVTGAEFYDSVKDLKAFGALYKMEASKSLDIYALAGRSVMVVTKFFSYLHNGILPTYMVWCLLGMIGLFIALFLR